MTIRQDKLEKMRHSCSHVLAAAVLELYPQVKFGIGPAIEEGFYYDFDFGKKKISEADLEKITLKMEEIIKAKHPFKKEVVSIKKAQAVFKNQPFKLELIKDLAKEGEKKVSLYHSGDFTDLCAGPHMTDTSKIGPFKLLSIAGAYWRGNEKNPMLTRIYGTCFSTQKELDDHLKMLEEAKQRDHRKIGREQELFSFHPSAPGDVFWHPKGLAIYKELYQYWQKIHHRENYVEVRTPEILTRETWDQSGHTTFFIDKMYRVTTPGAKEWDMAIKPMNCDGGILIYKSKLRSYREFPLRMAEYGVVHRFESSGEVQGLFRVREFTQDDAHIYCTPDQVKEELKRVIDFCLEVYNTFGLELDHLELSTRPEKSIGSKKIWDRAESIMKQVLKEKKVPHKINEGEGAFYGPKFDFHLRDAIGRTWQCATIQLDFAQPENFNLEYVTKEGKKEQPVMIHRVLYGSVERFFGILIEHYAGAFPTWLAPVQVVVIPITDGQLKYAQEVSQQLKEKDFRVELDDRNETTSAKIRDAEIQKVPYMLILGEKEVKAKNVSVRARSRGDLGQMKLEKFMEKISEAVEKKLPL